MRLNPLTKQPLKDYQEKRMSVIIAQDVRAAAKGDVNDSNLASVLSGAR
ncbi:hypothetical protein EMEDMD4_1190024 [Sinorhizobium medicae]|uniref:Uncharacterized protein n=1 Tax=Sinorhizobium medicae TaxID=110321 RepID=A0A508WQC7_9HYPH|nr:hypothetical protein EMEDMD4_1190024 [Sinorhizobium medicae]